MAHWTAHKAAWFPGRMRVCGVRLQPFRLGHLRLLECIESPYLVGGDATVMDLAAAVALLRLPWRVARWAVGRRGALSVASWLVARKSGREWQWHEESDALSAYVEQCLWTPEQFKEDGAKDGSVFGYASSFSMRVAARLAGSDFRALTRAPCRQVWDMTVTEALAWAVTASELSGRNYVTRDEMDAVQAMAAAQAAKEAAVG